MIDEILNANEVFNQYRLLENDVAVEELKIALCPNSEYLFMKFPEKPFPFCVDDSGIVTNAEKPELIGSQVSKKFYNFFAIVRFAVLKMKGCEN